MLSLQRFALAVSFLGGIAQQAGAWGLGSQLDFAGCHEVITAETLRNVRKDLTTAPVQTPTRDQAALFADVQFGPPADMLRDVGGMTLLIGIRDNDLKGVNPTDSLSLVQVHGHPENQDEHCLRSTSDDGAAGEESALAACRKFIQTKALAALAGLDASGKVDPTHTMEIDIWVNIRGYVKPPLPLFWLTMGQAMHALQDGFTHTNRTADGMRVTSVRNWVDPIEGKYVPERDGLEHRGAMDDCGHHHPLIDRNYQLAIDASTELLHAALDPKLSLAQKTAQFEAITLKYLSYQAGCTFANDWCNAEEETVEPPGCSCDVGRAGVPVPWAALFVLGVVIALRTLRRARSVRFVGALVIVAMLARGARADELKPDPDKGVAKAEKPVTPDAAPDTPLVLPPVSKDDVESTQKGEEPGRDTKTPTMKEVQSIRADKRLGSIWGFDVRFGASSDRPALAFSAGVRYRFSEKWVVGFDVGWNPWITLAPRAFKNGVLMYYATVIRRFPMSFDRVNIRTSAHLGASTLLFDVYGAPASSTGPYIAISPLGLDFDLGKSWRIVWDPSEIAIPVPVLGSLPLYYEQFRFMLGVQWGA